jgi:hypothetical protein
MRQSRLCWNSARDWPFIALATLHGVVIVAWPALPLIAIGVWWNSNTISHNFIHRPFFSQRSWNLAFSGYLSLLLGIPQTLWRDRHLAHHSGVRWRWRASAQLFLEIGLVLSLWTALAVLSPRFFASVYLPAYVIGLTLCTIQGHYEHARGVTSHYGRVYNVLFFNDGFHAEHHSNPGVAWTRLPQRREFAAQSSAWPPLLRWLDEFNLVTLEKLVLRSTLLQKFVLGSHRRAFRPLLSKLPPVRHVAIVGGGLFPRTALIIRDLMPGVRISVIDSNEENLATARRLIGKEVEFRHCRYVHGERPDCDLIVIPLCFDGDREAIYHSPLPDVPILVHDWIWRRHGTGSIVSMALLKRLNLVIAE